MTNRWTRGKQMVADWVMWAGGILATGVGTVLLAFVRDYLKTRSKSRANESMLVGNDDDETHNGLTYIVSDNNKKLRTMEAEVGEVRDNVRDIKEVVIDSSENGPDDFGFSANDYDESEE